MRCIPALSTKLGPHDIYLLMWAKNIDNSCSLKREDIARILSNYS